MGESMRWVPRWLVRILGDDRNMLHPQPSPTFKCAECHRFVTLTDKDSNTDEFLHADDASPVCKPVGLYRDYRL
jgi:hypothetical protein